jgi:hypothetical protein
MIDFDLTEEQRCWSSPSASGARAKSRRGSGSSIASIGSTGTSSRRWPPGAARLLGAGRVRRRRHGLHRLGIASEELEYVDTSLRVIMSVHAGLNCLTLLAVGHRGSEAALSRAAGAGEEDRHLRPDRAGRRQRRARHPDGRRQEGRPLPADGREDVDLARRRRRQLPGVRLDRSREEEAARPVGHQRLHRRARLQGLRAAR